MKFINHSMDSMYLGSSFWIKSVALIMFGKFI